MMKEMKKQDLMTGDIVVTRDGSAGIVIVEKEVIIYPESGMDFFDDLTEDLLLDDDYRGGDIMAVYRAPSGSAIGFLDYEDDLPIYEREDDVVWTDDMHWKNQQQKKSEEVTNDEPKLEEFYGVIQAFYGNRTGISFTEESVDYLVMGKLSRIMLDGQKLDRSMIHIPGEDGLVLLYNKYEEEGMLQYKEKLFHEDGYVLKPLAEIPELDIKLYSRCFACRIDAEGKVGSLKEEDYEKVMKYLAE